MKKTWKKEEVQEIQVMLDKYNSPWEIAKELSSKFSRTKRSIESQARKQRGENKVEIVEN